MTPPEYALALFGGVTRLAGSSVGGRAGMQQFSGEPINISILAHAYRWAWLDRNAIDVFQHCWSVELEQEARRVFAPVTAVFERNADRLDEIRSRLRAPYHDCARGSRGVSSEFCMFNTASMAFSIQQVLTFVASHEVTRGTRYRRVVLSRPDLVFTELPPPLSDELHYPRGVVAVELVNISAMRGLGDTIFVLPSSAAARAMSRIFHHLHPTASYRWGWFASFIAANVTPGVRPIERIRYAAPTTVVSGAYGSASNLYKVDPVSCPGGGSGVDISRRLCSR